MKNIKNILISIYFIFVIIITLIIDLLAPLYYNKTTNAPYELKDSIPYFLFYLLGIFVLYLINKKTNNILQRYPVILLFYFLFLTVNRVLLVRNNLIDLDTYNFLIVLFSIIFIPFYFILKRRFSTFILKNKKILISVSILLYATTLLMIISSSNYTQENLIKNCSSLKDERKLDECMDKINFNTPQLSYNFIYSNKDLIIEDKNIEKKFINYFGISLSLCKNKCNNIDDGKSYYESLNNCLIKNNCTEQLIGYNSINCKKDFQESINKIPSKFQNLITLNSEKICNNYKDK